MNDIEIGDYVRDNSGLIGQLIRIERDDIDTSLKWYVIFDGKNEIYINKPYITKHSKNIIDLIEVGDFVNGCRIDLIDPWGVLVHEARGINRSGFSIPVAQYEEDIKTVETHEQHEQNRYTVERS